MNDTAALVEMTLTGKLK